MFSWSVLADSSYDTVLCLKTDSIFRVYLFVHPLQQVLMNFSAGLVMALVMFVIGLWSIVRSYQPNPIVAVFFFVCAACAAFSFVATYLLAMYGAAAGGVYGVLKVAENNLRLQEGRPRQPHMHNRPHYD